MPPIPSRLNKKQRLNLRRAARHAIHSGNVTKLLWATSGISSKPWLLKELIWVFDLAERAVWMTVPNDETARDEAERKLRRLSKLREGLNRLASVLE